MRKVFNVTGTQSEKPLELEVNITTVYIRENIERVENEEFVGWQYDEVQYDKDEYIQMLANKNEVKQIETKLLNADERYKSLNQSNLLLEDLKQYKLDQLDYLCGETIVRGFTYVIDDVEYLFSASVTAQSNFQGTDALFKEGLITEVGWSVVNVATGMIERVTLTKELFDGIKLQLFAHINSNISRLRDELQPLVYGALTKEEVDAIVW